MEEGKIVDIDEISNSQIYLLKVPKKLAKSLNGKSIKLKCRHQKATDIENFNRIDSQSLIEFNVLSNECCMSKNSDNDLTLLGYKDGLLKNSNKKIDGVITFRKCADDSDKNFTPFETIKKLVPYSEFLDKYQYNLEHLNMSKEMNGDEPQVKTTKSKKRKREKISEDDNEIETIKPSKKKKKKLKNSDNEEKETEEINESPKKSKKLKSLKL